MFTAGAAVLGCPLPDDSDFFVTILESSYSFMLSKHIRRFMQSPYENKIEVTIGPIDQKWSFFFANF